MTEPNAQRGGSRHPGLLIAVGLIVLCIAGCADRRIRPPSLVDLSPPATGTIPSSQTSRAELVRQISAGPAGSTAKPFVRYGQTPVALASASESLPVDDTAEAVTLNIEEATVAEIAEKVLGDLLGENYVIEADLPEKTTLRTTRPASQREIISLFEDLLAAQGAVLIWVGDVFRIVPANLDDRALRTVPVEQGGAGGIGFGTRVVALETIKPSRMAEILQPIVADGAIRSVDDQSRRIVLSGTRRELTEMQSLIDLFDVDWLSGMSIGLLPLQKAKPVDIAKEVLFMLSREETEGAGDTRVMPVERANAVLVISPSAAILRTIQDLIPFLDVAGGNGRSTFVYPVQNRSAAELADLVAKVFQGTGSAQSVTALPGGTVSEGEAGLTSISAPSGQGRGNGDFSIVADDAGNALIVRARPELYDETIALIESLDTLPSQVMLELMIAEVTLVDELRYGVEWFLRFGDFNGQFTAGAQDFQTPAGTGLSLLLAGTEAGVVINALSGLTDVNVVSNPSLMVIDNKPATLQVGDQVPVVLQSAVAVNDPDAPIVNSIQYRDTGVTLGITPRISDNGLVVLDIEQNVSDVVATTTSGIDSPTIQQRRIATTVAVNDGESLALGGLIRDEAGNIVTGVPVLEDLPLLGNAFRNTEDVRSRTELIIIITPRVVSNPMDARQVTEELKSRLTSLRPSATQES